MLKNDKTVLSKTKWTVELLHRLQNLLPRAPLLLTYKAFVRPHLYYGDAILDRGFSTSFHEKFESI